MIVKCTFTGRQKKNVFVVDTDGAEINVKGYFTAYPPKSLKDAQLYAKELSKSIHII